VNSSPPLAAIFGCSGETLQPDEKRFFGDADPLGFILFARNASDPEQVRRLVADLRDAVGRADAPVLIDQEGGRVQRLRPPHWREAPKAARFAEIAKDDPEHAVRAVRLNGRLLADELAALGIDVDCYPVLDVPAPGSDPIIGDRAFGNDPETVALLGRAACEGLLEGGVLPVIKHIPGHGRATVDSHKALPSVAATLADLAAVDFAPFRELAEMPWAMTAHVLYRAIDAKRPATLSPAAIDLIRGDIGFAGVLVSDDLSMEALSGTLRERAAGALAAGCDIALHCNGRLGEMQDVAAAGRRISPASQRRIDAGEAMRGARRKPLGESFEAAVARLEGLLAGA